MPAYIGYLAARPNMVKMAPYKVPFGGSRRKSAKVNVCERENERDRMRDRERE